MQEKKQSVVGLMIGLLLILGIFVFHPFTQTAKVGDAFGSYIPVNVSTSSTASTVSSLILGASSARRYAIFVNDGANTVYLSAMGTSTANKGIRLEANGGRYEINTLNPIISAIYAITATSTSNITITASQ